MAFIIQTNLNIVTVLPQYILVIQYEVRVFVQYLFILIKLNNFLFVHRSNCRTYVKTSYSSAFPSSSLRNHSGSTVPVLHTTRSSANAHQKFSYHSQPRSYKCWVRLENLVCMCLKRRLRNLSRDGSYQMSFLISI